ncbi:retinitis pigmentosa 1-like 1 protein [Oncorhynchus mykiss]|uniref:retinitis pigmentosa 1-like 1 protein n=1 Tax=Oncorhynchus mykiss TaxID=8022 RepID=UPI00187877A1|nr:retinitis pigmentosa 1-like 1 protein [Oncorhynchus mykiss]
MQSAPAGLWDPHGPQSKDVSSLPVHTPSASRLSHVIAAPPAKRITFYKSGDAKFAGVRMAVHKRSFKCFDALLDDLSQKVPLPFGVRTVTTPRGIHSIKHLEQLEDGGCYLCSDRRQAKPINIELAGKRPALWHHNSRRVPQRPAEDPPPPSAPSHTPTRQRRILLVRNSDPAVRRSVILSRRSARSLRVFLEGISELMQCHVRKLYTLEGRKIDSAQSLMTCPGVLVCVGREPFRPLLLNYVAKHSEEKLPGLGTRSPGSGARSPGTGARSPRNGQGARSRSSVYSEGHGSKRNVNFGLETKKTIIHPLSDSSNRSTRFSLSSDKSYPNGLSSQGGKEAALNDDIEKRVLVNKDGSLSVEMRVRFRLHNDERLQWSTEIKKSPSDSLTNDCCPLREAPPYFLQQGQSESCSDPDSASCVVEAADYTPKPPQRSLEEPQSHYACCFQRQEYDLWENPAHIQTSKHSHSRVRHTHSSSSSSSCRSSKLVRRRATHRECSELGRVVHGMVEVCTVSSSCSHSELNLGATDNQGEERPLSSSSHVLQALQDDVDDLPPSISRCCHSNDPPQALPLTPQPPSPMSTSSRSRKHTPALQGEERGSKTSSRRSSNSCSCCRGEVTPKADEERVDSSLSKASHASHESRAPSNRIRIPVAPEEGDDEAEQGGKRAVSVSGGSGGSIGSVGSIGSSVCSHCEGCDQGYDPVSCHSQKSHRSKRSQEEEEEERSGRGLSGGSDECGFSQRTNKSNCTHFYQEGRAASMMSHMSLPKEGEDTGTEGEVEVGEKIEEGEKDERAASVLSAKSFSSVKGRTSRTSQKSKASESLADMEEQMEESMEGEVKEGEVEDGGEQRAASIMSVKSNLSANSSRSHKSTKSRNARAASTSSETPEVTAIETTGEGEEEEVGEKTEERLESSMSVRSNLSAKSRRSCKSTCSKAEQVLSAYSPEVPATEPEPTGEDEGEERATISTSVKSNLSAKSSRSHKSTCSRSIRVVSPKPAASETLVNDPADADAAGALSAKTNASAKSRRSCKSTGDDEGEEREARAMSAKTRASIKFSRTHKSACKAASPKPAACETPVNDPEEKTEEEKTASALSAKTSASVRASRSHKSTCSRSVRAETPVAKDIPAIETTEGDENGSAAAAGETEERPASAILDNNNASVKSSISHKSTCSKAERAPSSNSPEVPATEPEPTGDDEGEKRAASATSKSSRSLKSTCSRNVWAETPGTKDIPVITTTGGEEMVDDTTAAGDTEERPPSAISAKTSASVKSSRSHKSTCSRKAESQISQPADVPVIETTGRDEVGEEKERADGVMSAKSNASAMSRKSNRPTCNGSSRAVSPVAQDIPAIETTGGKEPRDKSTASVKTNRSHKSSSGRRAETPTAEQADVNETTGRDEKGEGTERPASAMSTKYSASAKSSRSHKSTCNSGSARAVSPAPKAADVPAIETKGVDREGEKTEERPACAMSSKSYISAKSSTYHTSNGGNRSTFLHLKKERGERGVRPAPSTTGNDLETGSVKSAMSTKPKRNADSSTRPLSTASQANAKSTNQTPPATTETKEESQSHATSRPASTAAHRDDDVRDHVTEKKAPSVHSKSPAKAEGDSRAASFARSTRSKVKVQKASEAQDDERPETRASFLQVKGHRVKAQSDTGSVHSVKTSKTDKIVIKGNSKPKSGQAGNPTSQSINPSEGSRPAIQLGTASVSDSLLSQSLSAADLLRGNMAASRLSSPAGSKVSIPDSGKSGKSGSSQRRRKLKQEEAELEELGPLCLPKTSPNDIVSDWLRGIPADSGMDNPEDEMNEGIEETEVKREEEDEKGGETEGQGGEETEEKQEPIETTEMEQENTAETGKQEEEQENTAEKGQQEEEEEQENTAETGQQEEEEEQENMAETGQQDEEEEQENMAETGQREEEEEQENMAETGQQEEEEEQENMAETGQEEEEQENMAETGQEEEEEEQENMAETGQQEEEEEQENTAETGQQEEEEEQENMAETGQQDEEEEQENMAETGQREEEEEQENMAETGQQEEEEEQENMAETGQEEEEQENMAETGQEEEEQENMAETGQQDEEVKKAARQPEEEGEVKEEEEERGEEEEAAAGEKEKKDKEEEEVKKEEEGEVGAEEEEGECSECADCCPDPAPPNNDISSPCHRHLFLSRESELPWSCHSSVAVMKVLLNPTLGRCSSLPEISPVYGRRLSSSAKGLLDCLAQLQLIDPPPSPAAAPGPDRDQRYQEVMDILESLWLSKPDLEKRKEGETEEKERLKDSGVDLSSGSAGSGGSGKTRPDETAGDITLIAKGEGGEGGGEGETDRGTYGGGEGETDGGGEGETYGGGEGETDGGGEEAPSAELLSDAATPDIASQVRSSPGEDESPPESPPGTGEMLQTLERLKTPGSPSSSDSTAYKSPTDTETDTPEDTPSSGTPPSVQRPLLTKRVSQDPDPVWVLNLLKKLEKQFMTHYVDAMAELKVRWDLDNNVMLDTMITELRDEVKKRIQMSIDRELRKIRGRAGRGPRPPNMSRESTVTDQRRRRLKVMKVQSVNESDGEQGSGDVSDQRSEDEYCPCDACIRKKAEDKAIKMEAVVAKAPVMMAFDLRKILQMKKDPESPAPPSPTQGKNNDKLEEEEEEEQVGNLEVVHEDEEEEERKEDIIPTVIEEDISEKEEEGVTGGEEGEEEGQESHGAESLMGEVEEEIAEEIGAEEQEEDGVVEGTEDEEEEAGEGETGCESAGEDGVEGVETGEGEELVEGEEEEAGEAEAGDHEKVGVDEAGDQEEAAGDEETGVAGETGGEEETPEEETEGNVGVSAEDEEEGGEEEVQLNAVAEFNPEDEEGEEMEGNREIPLIHQMTRTSVESQPGSMENTDPEPRASDPVSQMCSLTLIEPNETVSDGHQMASAGEGSGGKGQRRSRSPARTKRRKPKENGIELDVLYL